MQIKRFTFWTALLLSAAMFWGCGSNGGGGDSLSDNQNPVDPVTGISFVMSTGCIDCHEGFAWSDEEVSAFLQGKHVIHSDHINAESGEECLACHDPIGDGAGLAGLIDSENVPAEGLAAVGCENCHGAGAEHYGHGPMPYPTPNYEVCAKCHDTLPDSHLPHHPEANNIGTKFADSAHAGSGDRNEAICVKCHTDEGGRAYKEVVSVAALETVALPRQSASPVQCRTCHDPHNAGALLKPEVSEGHGDSEEVVESSEYATCSNCHQAHDAQLGVDVTQLAGSESSDGASGDLIYHAGRYERVISSTHYDDPATSYENGDAKIEGYTMDPTNDHVCRDCHDVHSTDLTYNREWATSGHAGGLLLAKQAANADNHTFEGAVAYRAAGATDETSNGGFTHYDWDAKDRQSCQMCHTATGFVNYVADPENYDAANNDFSHLEGWNYDVATDTVTSSGQNELLYCWGCHADNSGALRVEGPFTATYTYGGEPIVFPDSGSSNTCYVCHAGRGNNEVVSTGSRFAGHHAPAAATLFSELTHVAYEYPGLNYSNVPYFVHDTLELDGSGPCAACHMTGEKPNHEFAVVNKNAEGVITGIRADNCVNCHDGEHALFVAEGQVGETLNIWNGTAAVPTVVTQEMVDEAAAELEHESEGYQNAGLLLNDLLNQDNGLGNYTNAKIDNSNTVENDLGAFQNAKLPTDEKGGFAHNRYYIKRALFDAIDWVEDGEINGVIEDYSSMGTEYQYADAILWLGTERP